MKDPGFRPAVLIDGWWFRDQLVNALADILRARVTAAHEGSTS